MKGASRWLVRSAFGTAALLGFLLAVGVLALELAGRRIAAESRIDTPNGIESLEVVRLGGVDQTIYLRGRDRDAPVLLFLHGGPGLPEMPLARRFGERLEEHFVIVHWDQRGAGSSCTSQVPEDSLRLEQYLADTLELVNLLRERFGVEKIYLLGHSWGSVLGVLTAQRHPELLRAYIGMGQIAHMQRGEEISYRFVVDRARADRNTAALADLAEVHPPYADTRALMRQRDWLDHYGGVFHGRGGMQTLVWSILLSPEYGPLEKLFFYGCVMNSVDRAWHDLAGLDFFRDVPRLEVPVYFFMGRHDYNTPFEVVEAYSELLAAPHKEIVWFEHSGHRPNLEEPEAFQAALIERVLAETSNAQQ